MIRSLALIASFLAAVLLMSWLSPGGAQPTAQQDVQQEQDNRQDDVEHGRYLVHDVCLCVVCHSPRDEEGEPIESRLLTGGTIPLASPYPQQDWAFRAPKIAGLPAGWTEEELIQFLQTRDAPHGRSVRLPMPPFHLSEQDARDVAAYLLSLR